MFYCNKLLVTFERRHPSFLVQDLAIEYHFLDHAPTAEGAGYRLLKLMLWGHHKLIFMIIVEDRLLG